MVQTSRSRVTVKYRPWPEAEPVQETGVYSFEPDKAVENCLRSLAGRFPKIHLIWVSAKPLAQNECRPEFGAWTGSFGRG